MGRGMQARAAHRRHRGLVLCLLLVAVTAPLGAGVARAATLDPDASSFGGNFALDLSGPGRITLSLELFAADPALLVFDLEPGEGASPIVLEVAVTSLIGDPLARLELGLPDAGASFGTVGDAADAAGVPVVVEEAAGSAALVFEPGQPTGSVEVGDPLGLGGQDWAIDASGLTGATLRLEILPQLVPEPSTALLLTLGLLAFGLAGRLRSRRERGALLVVAACVPVPGVVAAPGPALADEVIVESSADDGGIGTLRTALTQFAEAGDVIVFNTPEVVLTEILEVPASLTGLVIRGPVTLRAADGPAGLLRIAADGVVIEDLTIQDLRVTATGAAGAPLAGPGLLRNTLRGAAQLALSRATGCVVEANDIDVAPDTGFSGILAVIDLSQTEQCRVSGNQIRSPLRNDVVDDRSEDLVIEANDIQNAVTSAQQSGAIRDNDANFVNVIPDLTEGTDSGRLVVSENRVELLGVWRTNIEVSANEVTTDTGQGLAAWAMRVTNDDPEGPAGDVVVRDNVIRGGRIGLLYLESPKSAPGELRGNDVAGCYLRGIRVARGRGTRILENEVTDCGIGTGGRALDLYKPEAVHVEGNRTVGNRGTGIAVVAPADDETLLHGNTATDNADVGIGVREGPGIVHVEANVVARNGTAGVAIIKGARARILGGSVTDNTGPGVLVLEDGRTEISEVTFGGSEGPGIDLLPEGVTPNAETKLANGDLDWPRELAIDATQRALVGQTEPGARVEVYEVEGGAREGNPMNGEGAVFLGSVLADGAGRFAFPLEEFGGCDPARLITTTATVAGAPAVTSEFSPDFPCEEPPPATDTDGDGVVDSADRCPDTDAAVTPNEDGCADTVAGDDDVTAFCNDADACTFSGGMGVCTDCSLESDPFLFDCHEGGECSVVSGGTASCDDCIIASPAAAPDFELDCSGADCTYRPDETLVCRGEAGGCGATVPDLGSTGCDADLDCTLDIDPEAVRQATRGFSEIVIQKRTTGGDGSFAFSMAGPLDQAEADQSATRLISTSVGIGTSEIRQIRLPGRFIVMEQVPEGWTLVSTTCGEVVETGPTFDFEVEIDTHPPGSRVVCIFENEFTGAGAMPAAGVEMPEMAMRTETFGLPPGDRITITGDNGWAVLDAKAGTVPTAGSRLLSFVSFPGQQLVGTLVALDPLGTGADGVFAFGPLGGQIRQFDPDFGDFGFTQLVFGSYTDAVHLDNDPASSTGLVVRNDLGQVRAFGPTEFTPGVTSFIVGAALVSNGDLPGASGAIVSAYAEALDAPMLVVTDGAPGELWLVDPAAAAPRGTLLGTVGAAPRRVRCAAGICAVSSFGSDTLSIATWSGGTEATLVGTVPASDGPVGIDVRAVSTGASVVSTGFGDDTVRVTEVAPDGTVLSNVAQAVPDGCTAPGHALFLRDAAESLVVTCNGSDAFAVLAPFGGAALSTAACGLGFEVGFVLVGLWAWRRRGRWRSAGASG